MAKILGIVLTLGFLPVVIRSDSCERLSACSCECPSGIIDIEPLGSKDGSAKYKAIQAQDRLLYSYNPCFEFSEDDPSSVVAQCENVAMADLQVAKQMGMAKQDVVDEKFACQIIAQSGVTQFYDIGTQHSARFETRLATDVGIQEDGEVVVAMYTSADNSRQTEVALVCNNVDDSTDVAAIGEIPQSDPPTYRFVIVSPDACYIPIGLSPGTIMIIVFFSGVAAYLLFGVIYKKFIAKASGREIIPNSDLWFSLPTLIKLLQIVEKLLEEQYGYGSECAFAQADLDPICSQMP